jgi:iron complex transport system substrate-binding protein
MVAALCLAALATGCAPEPPAHEVQPPATGLPTIVSLNPCTDAVLDQIAAPGQLLAVSHWSHDARASSLPPGRARTYRATGGTVEEVLALDPDIVVASTFVPPATKAALERLGYRVETFGAINTVADALRQVERLAAIAGREAEGARLAGEIYGSVAPFANAYTGAQREPEAALWQPGGIIAGNGALIAQLLRAAGFRNYGAARGLGQAAYLPLEQLVADPPDVLLVAGVGPSMEHPVLRDLTDTLVVPFDPSLIWCGGPTIPAAVERLSAIRLAAENERRVARP